MDSEAFVSVLSYSWPFNVRASSPREAARTALKHASEHDFPEDRVRREDYLPSVGLTVEEQISQYSDEEDRAVYIVGVSRKRFFKDKGAKKAIIRDDYDIHFLHKQAVNGSRLDEQSRA